MNKKVKNFLSGGITLKKFSQYLLALAFGMVIIAIIKSFIFGCYILVIWQIGYLALMIMMLESDNLYSKLLKAQRGLLDQAIGIMREQDRALNEVKKLAEKYKLKNK